MIYFFKDDLGVEHNREMLAPFSAKLMERIRERCNELLIDESDIELWIVTNDRFARIDQCLDYTSEAYLALVNFVDSLTVIVVKACLYLVSGLQECWMTFLL